jgi:hypothetical protein
VERFLDVVMLLTLSHPSLGILGNAVCIGERLGNGRRERE